MQTNNQNLIKKLKCPTCGGDVFLSEEKIVCQDCRRVYESQSAIPKMINENVNLEHLEEEEVLFQKMQEARENKKVSLSKSEWRKSKQEFWNQVGNDLADKNKDILNIGCGYDSAFVEFELAGHIFINLDIIESSLKYLQRKYSAKHCILADINNLPFKDDSFDVITCIDILHHEGDNLDNIIASIYKNLKLGGTFYLEDINAWGLFQFYKSILLPKFLHGSFRSLYHKIKKSEHVPARYEFPTNPFVMKRKLEKAGFKNIRFYEKKSYPESGRFRLVIYKILSLFERVNKYHNYHYFLKVEK